jgi:hypothetical protein
MEAEAEETRRAIAITPMGVCGVTGGMRLGNRAAAGSVIAIDQLLAASGNQKYERAAVA